MHNIYSPAIERMFAASTLATGMGAVAFPDNSRLMQVPYVSRMSAVGSNCLGFRCIMFPLLVRF